MASGALTILGATYASSNRGGDVTFKVQQLVANGNDDIPVNSSTFQDPDVNSEKYFSVWYTSTGLNNGNPVGLACQDGEQIDLAPVNPPANEYCTPPQPSLRPSTATAITVVQAIYGTLVNGLDVTAACQAIVNQGPAPSGTYDILIANSTFGGDPDVDATKSFLITYLFAGAAFAVGGSEGQTLSLPLGGRP